MGLNDVQARQVRDRMAEHDRREMPGMVRMSFGLYNTPDEVERFAEALGRIVRREFKGTYDQEAASGEFVPRGWRPDFGAYLRRSPFPSPDAAKL
jgi:hypothetical protein